MWVEVIVMYFVSFNNDCCWLLLSGDAHARRPLHKIHVVFFFVLLVSCWNIRFGAISNFQPTNSASFRENLRNRVQLFRQLWIFETIFSPWFSRFRKRSPSIPVISLSASLCSAWKVIKYSKPNAVRARRNAFMRDFPDFVEIYPYASFQFSQTFNSFQYLSDHIWGWLFFERIFRL